MLAVNNADRNLSEKKMEGDDGLRTLECLRGRLLAERAASRVAREEAELMGSKLIELENQLREEIKSKKKTEKKLNFLMKKLESLKIINVAEISELSISSDNFESTGSSSSTSSVTKNPEEDKNPKTLTDSEKCSIEEINHNSSEITSSNQDRTSPSSEQSSSPPNPANSNPNSDHEVDSFENFRQLESIESREDSNINDDHSLKSSMGGMEINGGNESVEEDENVDNSLALVLVPSYLQAPSQKAELKIVNKSVGEVLDALRHAREMLQSSMERRHVMKFGSIGTQIC